MKKPIQIIMIDNYDSFTYNLVDQFRQLDIQVRIFRNDTQLERIFNDSLLANYRNIIVISPGPGNPDTAGNTLEILKRFAGKIPVLGICLGHQAIVQHYGGKIGKAKRTVHGKADTIAHLSHPLFDCVGTEFTAARYHSLVALEVPDCLKVIAETKDQQDREVMAVVQQTDRVIGFQFHPESILTTHGKKLIASTLNWLVAEQDQTPDCQSL